MYLWVHSPEVATWIHEMSGYGAAATQGWDESRYSPLVPFGARNANKSFSVCPQKRQKLQIAADSPEGRSVTELVVD